MKIRHGGDYRKKREDEYPDVSIQLDMLWHSMNEGQIDKSEPFYSTIKTVKDKYPKQTINKDKES